MAKQRIAVLFGGASSEHEVSCVSASSVIANIPAEQYEIVCIGITKKGKWLFYPGEVEQIADGSWEKHPDCCPCIVTADNAKKGIYKQLSDQTLTFLPIDCFFPVLHGKNGEDGTIQGLFEMSMVPYVGCGTCASAVCMDKAFTHVLLESAGIQMAPYILVRRSDRFRPEQIAQKVVDTLGFPVFVKPANAGSSVGVSRPIGVLDSGMGGLTAVRELQRALPCEDIVYFGDTGRVPYGTRSAETVVRYAMQDVNFLLSHGVKMVIAACGTVTTTLPQNLTDRFPFPYTGVLHPTVRAAAAATRNGKIGVIATALDLRYQQLYREGVEMPEDSYHGQDIIDHAKNFAEIYGDRYMNASEEERRAALVAYALPLNIEGLERDLAKYRIHYDRWFRESTLHADGSVMKVVELLKEKNRPFRRGDDCHRG